jgi:hypothetical protein
MVAEACVIWNRLGRHRQVIGPQLVRLFYRYVRCFSWYTVLTTNRVASSIRFLTRFTARPDEYVLISHKDGRIEHVRGPVTMFLNPVHHDGMEVRDCNVELLLIRCTG